MHDPFGIGFDWGGGAGCSSAPDIIVEGLIAWWTFDEGAGQVLTDRAGTNNGTLGADASVAADDPMWTPQGLSFDGGDFVSFPNNIGISGTQPRSLLAVVKPGTGGALGIEWPGTGPNFQRWTLRNSSSPARLRLEVAGAGHSATTLDLTESVWTFVAATQSGADLNTAVLYKDALSEASTAVATIDTQGNLRFGTQNSAAVPMDMALGFVYNRALSAAEIERMRQVIKPIMAGRGIQLP